VRKGDGTEHVDRQPQHLVVHVHLQRALAAGAAHLRRPTRAECGGHRTNALGGALQQAWLEAGARQLAVRPPCGRVGQREQPVADERRRGPVRPPLEKVAVVLGGQQAAHQLRIEQDAHARRDRDERVENIQSSEAVAALARDLLKPAEERYHVTFRRVRHLGQPGDAADVTEEPVRTRVRR